MTANSIKTLRIKLKLTQAQFAQLLGVHAITVSRWESGLAKPTDYQAGMMESFEVAARDEAAIQALGTVLVSSGAIAAVFLLLQAALGGLDKKGEGA